MYQINEDSQLYSGIFWVPDIDEISDNTLYFQVPVDFDGNPIGDTTHLNAKSGLTFNHERTWEQLPSRMTHNKKYNYYPRGRVIISHGKATIWVNPNLCCDAVRDWCIDRFNLTRHNGITNTVIRPDYSEHYKCYLD